MPEPAPTSDFEKTLEELEALVTRMEQGELTLEDSLRDYERGIELSRRCQRALERAEQRIRVLTEAGETDMDPAAAAQPQDPDRQEG